jgi:phage-related protein
MSSRKVVEFLGDTRKRIRGWPAAAKQLVGWQLESLHAFQKTSQKTEKRDIALARRRLAELLQGGGS